MTEKQGRANRPDGGKQNGVSIRINVMQMYVFQVNKVDILLTLLNINATTLIKFYIFPNNYVTYSMPARSHNSY